MTLEIVRLPDLRLKSPCAPVELHQAGLQPFIDRMIETLHAHPRCVGLAANQVGKSWQVMVVDAGRVEKPGTQHGLVVLLNPRLLRQEGRKVLREGCLSVPDFTGNVIRATRVRVGGLDRSGKPLHIEALGFEAVVFQHELDHLEGKLFLDRVASLTTDVFRRQNYG